MEEPLDEEEMCAEEKELVAEMQRLRDQMEERRKEISDTDFVMVTEAIPDLGRLKFRIQRHLRGHLAKVNDMSWCWGGNSGVAGGSASDSQLLVSASQDGKLIVWDSHSGNKLHMIPLKTAWVIGCDFSAGGEWVASGGLDNLISLFRVDQRETPDRPTRELSGHEGYISALKFIPETSSDQTAPSTHLLSASGDKSLMLWDMEVGKVVSSHFGHNNDVISVAVSAANPHAPVSVSSDCTARLWDLRLGPGRSCTQIFFGHEKDINGVCMFPQSAWGFVTASDDGTCRLWDIRADQEVASYIDDFINCGATCCALSKSGRLLIAGYDDFNCHVWDLLREVRVGIMAAHEDRVSCVYVSPDGAAIATGAWDSNCLIWTAK